MPPANPKIYHITHVNNLPSIIAAGELISDAAMIQRGGPPAAVGMSKIKQRRLGLPHFRHRRPTALHPAAGHFHDDCFPV